MSDAELLLELADAVQHPRALLIVPTAPLGEDSFARIRLALELRARPAVAFRAIAEGWDRFRLISELY